MGKTKTAIGHMRKLLSIFLLLTAPVMAKAASYPRIFFETGEPLDGQCKTDTQHQITQAMHDELEKRLPEFQKLWDTKNKELMATTVTMFHRDFGREEESMTLHLCPWFSPMSSPLSMRIREYLKSATTTVNPNFFTTLKPEFYFVSQVYHEMLHRYLDHNFPDIDSPRHSALVKKYEKESGGVLIHLHLLAIQKAVYLKLHRESEIQKIIDLDSQIGPIYKRAWEIVNAEGHDRFISELKK